MAGEGNGTPLQYSCLENPMDGGAWWAAVHVVSKSHIRLSNFTFTFHFHALEKEMATHSSVLAWRIPGTGEPGGLPSVGSHRVGHDWSDLAAAACNGIENNLPDTNILKLWKQIQGVSLTFFWLTADYRQRWVPAHSFGERKSILVLQEDGSLFQEVRNRYNKEPEEDKLFSNREKGRKVPWRRWEMQLSQLQNL